MAAAVIQRGRVIAALVVAAACVARRSNAQDTSATRAADARCDSVVAASRVDTVSSGLFLALKRADGGDLATEQIMDMLLLTGAAFIPPKPFRLNVFSGPALIPSFRRIGVRDEPVLRQPTLTGAYRVKVDTNEVFTSLETVRASLMPGFDSAAMLAIKAAGTSKGLFAPRDGTRSATIEFRFATDSIAVPGWTVRRLVTATFPRMPVTDAAVESSVANAGLPETERREGQPAETVLRFVVDRTGRPIMETLEVVRGTSIDFVRAALTALAKQHFVPAKIHGCGVAQQVEVPFTLPPLSPSGSPPPDHAAIRY
ncbi:MAG TPA: energy transducer TonB [Gemmatimonadaceae bacterium]